MNPIHRIRRSLARLAGPAGAAEQRASMLPGPAARRPGCDGVAGRFIQDVAAAASMTAGHRQVARCDTGSRIGPWPGGLRRWMPAVKGRQQ